MAATLGTAIFTRLFSAGMQRLAGPIFQKIVRVRKIDAPLKGEAAKNPAIKTAMHDFEVVLGSYQGDLTQQIDKFLRDLEKSGLIDAIAQQALLKRRSSSFAL